MTDRRPAGASLSNARPEVIPSSVYTAALSSSASIAQLFYSQVSSGPRRTFAKFRSATFRTPAKGVYASDDKRPVESWAVISWDEAGEHVAKIARYLSERCGVKKGDRVAILSSTRYEWLVADLAILSLGAVSTPIYQTSIADEAGFILWDSGATFVFIENEEQLEKISSLSKRSINVPGTDDRPGGEISLTISGVISFEEISASNTSFPVASLPEILGSKIERNEIADLRERVATIRGDDLASIVYTSGTTGVFKGVVQTHQNHLAMLRGAVSSGLLGDGHGIFLFLPLAHSFARLIAYAPFATCGDLIFPTVMDRKRSQFNAKHLFKDIRASNPTLLPSVPRIFEKIMANLSGAGSGSLGSRFTGYCIRSYQTLTKEKREGKALSLIEKVRLAVASFVVAKVRAAIFGKGFKYAISGGAPLGVDTLLFFDSIGVRIFEGYGLTETTPALTANTPAFRRVGSVGRPFPGVELKIAEDGEILCRGENIALGYWQRPNATAESWLQDGWFATGDIGEIDEDGYLKITDRKKELIVNAGGKKIAPAFLEGRLKTCPLISLAFVFGDKRPYLVALLTLEPMNAPNWAASRNLPTDLATLATHPALRSEIETVIDTVNGSLANYEQIRKFAVLPEDFTVENGLLTPTLKLRRRTITERYAKVIEELYR